MNAAHRARWVTSTAADDDVAVLYLRSFHFDDSGFGLLGLSFPSVEERLVSVLSKLGNVAAIGAPGERLPPLGATRIYASADDWRDVVTRMMLRARVVVLVAGTTPSLQWEIAAMTRLVDPRRVLIVLPTQTVNGVRPSAAFQAFSDATVELFPRGLPPHAADAAWITFDSDWSPRLIRIPRWKPLIGQAPLSRAGMAVALRPFFSQADYAQPHLWPRLTAVFVPSLIVTFLLGILLVGWLAKDALWNDIYSVVRPDKVKSEERTFIASLPSRWIYATRDIRARSPVSRATDHMLVMHVIQGDEKGASFAMVERFAGAVTAGTGASVFVEQARQQFVTDHAEVGRVQRVTTNTTSYFMFTATTNEFVYVVAIFDLGPDLFYVRCWTSPEHIKDEMPAAVALIRSIRLDGSRV